MGIVLVATLKPNPADRREVQAILEELIPRVHAEDQGCELYSLHEDGDDFVFVEKWADQAALDAHMASEATRAMMALLDGKLIGSEARFLSPIPAGDGQLGQI